MADDDKNFSELLSQSMNRTMDADESKMLEKHLEESQTARQFSELSRSIQNSVARAAVQTESDQNRKVDGDDASLSQDGKDRLRASLAEAVKEKLRLSQAGLISSDDRPGDQDTSKVRAEGQSDAPGSGEPLRSNVRFRRIKKIGEGGLGNVWLAKDERLNRNVAVKELKDATLESPATWSRFQREAAITGRLEHPNIVPLYFYGDERGTSRPFYAMRFVGKRTLANAIEEHHDRVEAGQIDGTLGAHRLLTAFLDVCQAIAYAHSRGVVHRDLKPENIALDNFGQVIVLDWGLAKVLEDGELMQQITSSNVPNENTLGSTMANDIIGTPLYMAPEQARGDHDNVNEKTDIYGLGAVLFAMLTGKAPHEDTATQKSNSSVPEVLQAIAEGNTPDVINVKPDTPKDLAAICCRAMDAKQHLRYDSVNDLANDLELWMAGQSEKQSRYETIRMEGRELRAHLQSFTNDLQRNVRFMSSLPPIQEIVAVENDEDLNTWRERLSTIFRGLLGANTNYGSVCFLKIEEDEFTEIVRIERHHTDTSNIRSVPRSRLRTGPATDYMKSVLNEYPNEVLVSLDCEASCAHSAGCDNSVGLFGGTPIYDDRTEEPFGVVVIGCNIDRVLNEQLTNTKFASSEVVVACDIFHVMAHRKDGTIEDANSERVADRVPHYMPAVEHLQTQLEFVDDQNSEIYGCRIWFVDRPDFKHGVMYLLRK